MTPEEKRDAVHNAIQDVVGIIFYGLMLLPVMPLMICYFAWQGIVAGFKDEKKEKDK